MELGQRDGDLISPDCHSESACNVQSLHHPRGLAVLPPSSRSPSLPTPPRPQIKLLHMKPMVSGGSREGSMEMNLEIPEQTNT